MSDQSETRGTDEHDEQQFEWDADLGAQLIRLLWESSWWIKRRIEQITFDDEETIRRRTSLDISFDGYLPEDSYLPILGARALLPISLQPRRPSREVTVSTAGHEPLPHLNRTEERSLIGAGLARLSEELGPEWATEIPLSVRCKAFYEALELDVGAETLPDDWCEGSQQQKVESLLSALSDVLDDFAENRLIVAMPEVSELYGRPGDHGDVNRIRLHEDHPERVEGGRPANSLFRYLRSSKAIDSLRRFRWWSTVPRPTWLRRISVPKRPVEVAEKSRLFYHDSSTAHAIYFRDGTRSIDGKDPNHRPIWRRPPQPDDVYYRFHTRELQSAESFHVEVVCPPGVYVDEAWLIVSRPFGSDDQGEGATTAVEILEIEDDDPHWDAAHFYYFHALPEASWTDPDDGADIEDIEAEVLAVLRPMYHGVMRSGRNTSILTTMLLILLTFTVGWIASGLPAILHLPLRPTDANSVVSLLLLVPTIALALLVREDEHLLVKRVVETYRQRLAGIALSTFVLALLFAIGLHGLWLFGALSIATLVSSAFTVRTMKSAAYSRDQVARRLEFS